MVNIIVEFSKYLLIVLMTVYKMCIRDRQCSSKEKGKDVMAVCSTGCIGCRMCQKVCPADAIVVENNLAWIDPEKCTNCGACAEKCPKKIIL